ncbi:SRPBCC family protein [Arthrobacter sp. KNU40]|uniref:SRPBCC family protein n=1 Tax=Arthrobacter sp. KNU40 TaxID=3447965 RepID=UPI003F633F41
MLEKQEIISEAIRMNHGATKVWEVAKSPASIHLWHPGIVSSKLESQMREAVLEGGAVIVEQITATDNSKRSYSYAYVDGPLKMSNFTSTFTVNPCGADESEVSWSARFDKDDSSAATAALVEQMYRAGLTGLQEYLDTVLGTVNSREL